MYRQLFEETKNSEKGTGNYLYKTANVEKCTGKFFSKTNNLKDLQANFQKTESFEKRTGN